MVDAGGLGDLDLPVLRVPAATHGIGDPIAGRAVPEGAGTPSARSA